MKSSTTDVSTAVHARLFSERKPVTARWICYEHMCNMHTAQVLLKQLLTETDTEVTITHLIDGVF